jgi:glyoxylase-like metal-dependent hydrolase (beta-lactamase superfamily II)
MNGFKKEKSWIYRLKIPFDTVYTSVFLIRSAFGNLLVDCASSGEDVERYILPSLEKKGLSLSEIDALILTHRHSDHAGGLSKVLELAPSIKVISDVREIYDGIFTYPMAGHTEDCIGLLDIHSGTLISGDGLQGSGVDKYRCYTKSPEEYLKTLDRVMNDKRIDNLLFSHAYEPWSCEHAFGRKEVEHCICECKKYVKET